jgi:hypothetical protein
VFKRCFFVILPFAGTKKTNTGIEQMISVVILPCIYIQQTALEPI